MRQSRYSPAAVLVTYGDRGSGSTRGRLVACQETRLRRVRCSDEACDEETVQSPVSRWREAKTAAFGAAVDTEE